MMGDAPNAKAKWSKYKVEDGKLVRAEHCPECGPWCFSRHPWKSQIVWPLWLHRDERVSCLRA